MQIVLHIGVHDTDEDRLLKCLLRNTEKLAEEGIIVPETGRYRPVVREALQTLQDNAASDQMQQTLLDALVDDDEAHRVILSHDSFLGMPGRAIKGDKFFPLVTKRGPRLRNHFAKSQMEIFIALRNPATFLPALFARTKETDFTAFIDGSDPLALRWSDMIARLRQAVPDAPVTVWCNEDTPLIWYEILQRMSGHDEFTLLDGRDDFYAGIMSKTGLTRMQSYLKAHPPQNSMQLRRIIAAFLDKFALEDALEEEIDLPGWDEAYVDQLTANYDADVALLGDIEGVTYITP